MRKMDKDFVLNSESGRYTEKSYRRNSAHMLPVTDYLSDLPEAADKTDFVEVQFKNTRKGYYRNVNGLQLEKGMTVAVEGNPGHDVGEVTLVGQLVILQMRKCRIDVENFEARAIYRIATEADIKRAEEAHQLEHETMIRARKIAKDMQLEMKIGDVEYQGDGGKAIFYYIADGRVDFRQLIKVYAETFRIRIEMKQIGARQEAGRIGGTGPCGRELCCSTWMTRFSSVGTGAARLQNLSPNPQKLAGQCAKLKCCLNYDQRQAVNLEIISAERAKAIIEMNRRGEKPNSLGGVHTTIEGSEIGYANVVGQDDLNRFDRRRTHADRPNRPRNDRNQRPYDRRR